MNWPTIAGWYHAVLFGALPWVAAWRPEWAPLTLAGAALVQLYVRRFRAGEPWTGVVIVVSAAAFIFVYAGARGPSWLWLAIAASVAAAARWVPRGDGGRPDTADWLALIGWAAPFVVEPAWLATSGGGWVAPAVLLASARRLAGPPAGGRSPASALGPPTREVRGTLSLRGVVVASSGLPVTAPIELDLRAGESLAVLCNDPVTAQAVAETIVGRCRPHAGEIAIDGAPPGREERLAALIAPGEAFVVGDLVTNLGVLRDEPLDRAAIGAARDACGLDEAVRTLDGGVLAADGAPLSRLNRLLVLTARVLVSHYRIVVVVDPEPWVDARQSEIWRAALVRASVGRTAVLITSDPELADRADHVLELVDVRR